MVYSLPANPLVFETLVGPETIKCMMLTVELQWNVGSMYLLCGANVRPTATVFVVNAAAACL